MASDLNEDMNLNGSGTVTSWHAFLAEENKKKKKGENNHSNQDNFKRLVGWSSRKWSKLSDADRSHFASLATGKEERMTHRKYSKNKSLMDLDRDDDITSSTYV